MTRNPIVGDIVKVIANTNNNNYKIGERYRVKIISGDNTTCVAQSLNGDSGGNNLAFRDCVIVGLDKSYYEEQIAHHKSEIEKAKAIINWMDEAGVSEFDEQEFKVWEALTAFENDGLSKIEKAKLIAKIVKGS